MKMVYDGETDLKRIVRQSEMILSIPTNNIPMRSIEKLRKLIPSSTETAVLGYSKILEAVDSTPFCTMAAFIKSSNLLIFLRANDENVYASFMKWIRQESVSEENEHAQPNNAEVSNILAVKRDHIIQIQFKSRQE